MIFLLVLFYLLFGCCMVSFGQLLRGQPHSFDFNLRVFSIFDQTFIRSLVTRLAPKSNPSALQGMKGYWPIFKIFYSGIEIPLISPIIINNRAITNFIEKGNFFNILFLLCNILLLSMARSQHQQVSTEEAIGLKNQFYLQTIKSINSDSYRQ